jgi:transposase-like protein
MTVNNTTENLRELKGLEIAKAIESQITRINAVTYQVHSQTGNGKYAVCFSNKQWYCECPDFYFRHAKCKHIWAVQFSLKMREQVKQNLVIHPLDNLTCIFCGSDKIVKDALRHNKYGDIQRYLCKACGKRFSINIGFEKMSATPQVITSALQLYFTGESLRNVQKFLRLQGVQVSHSTVLRWIKRYVDLMDSYLEQIKPNVSDTWRADELYVKIKGDMKYLFALMDDQTRYWIAQEVAESKYRHDARKLFQLGVKATGKKPMALITDGLPAYQDACKKEFWAHKLEDRTEHIRNITLRGNRNNNKMERMNGEIRDREKVMRGLKKTDTPILKGYQLFHNWIRPHEGLEGKTPSEACGIKVEGQNKWITLIQNASTKRKPKSE